MAVCGDTRHSKIMNNVTLEWDPLQGPFGALWGGLAGPIAGCLHEVAFSPNV